MVGLHGTKCCGVCELSDISSVKGPLDVLKSVALLLRDYTPNHCAAVHPPIFVTFTGVTLRKTEDHASDREDDYGQALADYLTANNLGPVVASEARTNFTSNTIRLWIWHPDYPTFWRFMDKFGIKV